MIVNFTNDEGELLDRFWIKDTDLDNRIRYSFRNLNRDSWLRDMISNLIIDTHDVEERN